MRGGGGGGEGKSRRSGFFIFRASLLLSTAYTTWGVAGRKRRLSAARRNAWAGGMLYRDSVPLTQLIQVFLGRPLALRLLNLESNRAKCGTSVSCLHPRGVFHLSRMLACLLACLTSQQHASVFQGRICTDNFTRCHTEI